MFASKRPILLGIAMLSVLMAGAAPAQVTMVEPGHVLTSLADSVTPSHASQSGLDTACVFGNVGNIESIAVDGATSMVYVQQGSPAFSFTSATSCIFSVDALTGVTTMLNGNTLFGINGRGTDMHFDPVSGDLITQDQGLPGLASVTTPGGATGVYATASPPVFSTGTFGMDFSGGAGGSDVPAGDVVFTSDVSATGLWSIFSGALASVLHATPTQVGDDVAIQPDGDWVHIPDNSSSISAYSPVHPHAPTPSATGLNAPGIFAAAGRPFIHGTRASVCDTNGMVYMTYSGGGGGSALFRLDEALTTASHVLDATAPKGIHDISVAPSSAGVGSSVYFTVHDSATSGEEVWEADMACGEVIVEIDIKFCSNPNGFNCKSKGVTPLTIFGTAGLDVTTIDISSLRLCLASDPSVCTDAPVDWSIDDRGDPTTDLGASQCAIIDDIEQDFLNPDTFDDLDVAFDTQELTGLTGFGCPLAKNEASATLIIRGFMNDGTELFSIPVDDFGIDQVIRKGGKP